MYGEQIKILEHFVLSKMRMRRVPRRTAKTNIEQRYVQLNKTSDFLKKIRRDSTRDSTDVVHIQFCFTHHISCLRYDCYITNNLKLNNFCRQASNLTYGGGFP